MSFDQLLRAIRTQQLADQTSILPTPQVDERDIPEGLEGWRAAREEEALERGGVLISSLGVDDQQGRNLPGSPSPGDLVFLHYTIMDVEDNVVESTRRDAGGPGYPRPFVLAKSNDKKQLKDWNCCRPLRGIELALRGMKHGERCILQIKPEFAYLYWHTENKKDPKKINQSPPPGLQEDEVIKVDVQLESWISNTISSKSVRCIDEGVILQTIEQPDATGWETPRIPFEVTVVVKPTQGNSSSEQEVTCCLGDGTLCSGVEMAVCEMHRGETAKIWCPARLAVKQQEQQQELPNSSLRYPWLQYVEFIVTLVDFSQVRDLVGDNSVTKRTLIKGEGEFPADCPLEDTVVYCKILVRSLRMGNDPQRDWYPLPNSTDEEGSLRFETGNDDVPHPVESAVRLMLRGEIASVISDWDRSFGDNLENVPKALLESPSKGERVEFKIRLVDFDPIPNPAVMEPDERLDLASTWREQGNALFKRKKYNLARLKYLKSIRTVDKMMDLETEQQLETARQLKVACLVNIAACAQREERWGEVIDWCNKTIE